MLATFNLDEYGHHALKAGASGFLLKDASRDQLTGVVWCRRRDPRPGYHPAADRGLLPRPPRTRPGASANANSVSCG
jgi:hypothetical protein